MNKHIAKYSIILLYLLFPIKNYSQLQSENMLFSLYEKENFIIDDYQLLTEKGEYKIDDEPYTENWYNYFLKYKSKVIGRYTFRDEANFDSIKCELYFNDKKTSNKLGVYKTIVLKNFKKKSFKTEILDSFQKSSNKIMSSPEILNNKGYFLYKYKYYEEALLYLNKTIELSSSRVVAYLNIADCYWALNQKEEAKIAYQKYLSLMQSQRKDLKKVPKWVYERIK